MTSPTRASTMAVRSSWSWYHRRGAIVVVAGGLLLLLIGGLTSLGALWHLSPPRKAGMAVITEEDNYHHDDDDNKVMLTLQVRGDAKIQVVSDLHSMCLRCEIRAFNNLSPNLILAHK